MCAVFFPVNACMQVKIQAQKTIVMQYYACACALEYGVQAHKSSLEICIFMAMAVAVAIVTMCCPTVAMV